MKGDKRESVRGRGYEMRGGGEWEVTGEVSLLLVGFQQRRARGVRGGWSRGKRLTSVAGRTGGTLVLRGTDPGSQYPASETNIRI